MTPHDPTDGAIREGEPPYHSAHGSSLANPWKGFSSLSPGALKGIGIGCFVLCAALLFVAWERCQDYARKVEEANRALELFVGVLKQTTGSAPIMEGESEPGAPLATMISLLFAALSAIGGAVCFVVAAKRGGLAARSGIVGDALPARRAGELDVRRQEKLGMRITWKELTISPDGVDFNDLLSEWRWLVGEEYKPVVISALGDLFLRHNDGRIFWLNSGWGQLTQVAKDGDDFKTLMVQRDNANEWFNPNLVGDLLGSGKTLGTRQCFGFKTPPVLGGKIEPDNFEPTGLSVHFGILGQIHLQVKDLPPGTPIGKIKFK